MAMDALRHVIADLREHRGHLYGNVGTGALWTAVLDEQLDADLGADYAALRDEEAPLIHGMVHARNGVMHAALVAANAGGLTAPLTAPLKIGPPSWRTSASLHSEWTPRGCQGDVVAHRIAMYDRHLAGRVPVETFEEVLAFFERLRASGWMPQSFARRE